jgi:hypothetical protein
MWGRSYIFTYWMIFFCLFSSLARWKFWKVHHHVRMSRLILGRFQLGRLGKMRFNIAFGILTTYFKIRPYCIWPLFRHISGFRGRVGGTTPYWALKDGGMSSWNRITLFDLGFLDLKQCNCRKSARNCPIKLGLAWKVRESLSGLSPLRLFQCHLAVGPLF